MYSANNNKSNSNNNNNYKPKPRIEYIIKNQVFSEQYQPQRQPQQEFQFIPIHQMQQIINQEQLAFFQPQSNFQQQMQFIAPQNNFANVQRNDLNRQPVVPNQKKNNQQQNGKPQGQPNQQGNDNQNQKREKKENKGRRNHKEKIVDEALKDYTWECKVCRFQNKWTSNSICLECKENKYRMFDRMRKDIGQNDYDYLFFIDFECNSVPKAGFEIIEFPIHVVDVQSRELIETFSSYVRPSSKVTKFITKLTGITQNDVQNAPLLYQVLLNAYDFLEKYLQAGLQRCVIVYDCDSDADFIFKETQKKKIRLHPIFERFITLKQVFPANINNPPLVPASLAKMLEALKMKFEGKQHCGTDDSRNQALVGIELMNRGYNFSNKQEIKLGQRSSCFVDNPTKKKQLEEYKGQYEASLNYKLERERLEQQKKLQNEENKIEQQLKDMNLNN